MRVRGATALPPLPAPPRGLLLPAPPPHSHPHRAAGGPASPRAPGGDRHGSPPCCRPGQCPGGAGGARRRRAGGRARRTGHGIALPWTLQPAAGRLPGAAAPGGGGRHLAAGAEAGEAQPPAGRAAPGGVRPPGTEQLPDPEGARPALSLHPGGGAGGARGAGGRCGALPAAARGLHRDGRSPAALRGAKSGTSAGPTAHRSTAAAHPPEPHLRRRAAGAGVVRGQRPPAGARGVEPARAGASLRRSPRDRRALRAGGSSAAPARRGDPRLHRARPPGARRRQAPGGGTA